jgi:NADPH:quinone reductase-like Zn-dependent oxidoreductase
MHVRLAAPHSQSSSHCKVDCSVPPQAPKHILGVEFAGIVDEVGPEPEGEEGDAPRLRHAIQQWKKGDEVYGLAYGGAYAEYIVVYATHLIHKPTHLSFVEAASIPEAWLTGSSLHLPELTSVWA